MNKGKLISNIYNISAFSILDNSIYVLGKFSLIINIL